MVVFPALDRVQRWWKIFSATCPAVPGYELSSKPSTYRLSPCTVHAADSGTWTPGPAEVRSASSQTGTSRREPSLLEPSSVLTETSPASLAERRNHGAKTQKKAGKGHKHHWTIRLQRA